ncbi:hypothetical protein B0H10DRAFT_300772 [Mycena sp. CBHHK59/15]|nr:hypothetical protein B0H10DRAFT_300772 [Mycena sp. CBHHK59/15]
MFSSLHTLIVGPGDIESTTGFMAMYSGSPLNSVDVQVVGAASTAALEKFYSALATGCSHASLTFFLFKGFGFHIPQTERAAYVHPLSPLYRFANLTSVDIQSSHRFDVDDSTIINMARAWPRIESLRLSAR